MELCPMCKKHPAIIFEEEDVTLVKDTIVNYDNLSYYCPFLGEPGYDNRFCTGPMMNENLKRIREAYNAIKEKENERT